MTKQHCPKEEVEQEQLALWLDHQQLLWLHVPNEGLKAVQYMVKLKAQGLKTGAPDVFIFNPPPRQPKAKGVAIEVKKRFGGKLSMDQRAWLEGLQALGWVTAVCEGADSAIEFLQGLGYGGRKIIEVTDYVKKENRPRA